MISYHKLLISPSDICIGFTIINFSECTKKLQIHADLVQIQGREVHEAVVSGQYDYHGVLNNRPSYKHQTEDLYLFYAGWWKVDAGHWYSNEDEDKKRSILGFIRSDDNTVCPELASPDSWKYHKAKSLPYNSEIVVTPSKQFTKI